MRWIICCRIVRVQQIVFPYHNNVISACEGILKDLNPRFAKEKERDEDISNLKTKIGGIETKMDRILTLLSKGETK